MASPVVQTTAETAVTTAGTTHTITLPSGIVAGDLLIILLDKGSTAATINALAGWTELIDENAANGLFVAWRYATGGETNPSFISSAATRSASIAYRISGAADPLTNPLSISSTATGTSVSPDPGLVSPGLGSKDYLFIAFAGMAGEEIDDDTWANTPPTNYTPSPPLQKSCGTAGVNLGGRIMAATRQLTASSDDPGSFNVDVSAAWRAATIAVEPFVAPTVTPPPHAFMARAIV